jgi:acetyltransferase-like isoleucine patch superfamily enzyme
MRKNFSIKAIIRYYFERINGCLFKQNFFKIGRKCRIAGKPFINGLGKITAGDNLIIESLIDPVEIFADEKAEINIGNNVYINKGVVISARQRIDIGDSTKIGGRTLLMDTDYHGIDGNCARTSPIHIGSHVWICWGEIILKGVTIGNNSMVAAGSVVTRDVPPDTLVAGNPSKVIRSTTGWT